MSNTRKIISLILAVVMALGVFTICATAAGETATWTLEVTKEDGSALDATVPVDSIVKVTVKLQTNCYVGVVGLPVYFSDAFSVVANSAETAEIYGAGATRVTTNANYTAPTGYKAFYALFVPNSGASGVAAPMLSTATTILSFKLKADSEATAQVLLDATKQKTSSNAAGVFYVGYHDSASVSSNEGIVDTFTVPAATSVVIANAAADPVLTGINGGIVDDTNKYVYGVAAGSTVANYFSCTDGSFVVSGNNTGATLTVYKTDNSVFETYTVIILGDVDGDGEITTTDSALIEGQLKGIPIPYGAAALFAADVDGDLELTTADAGRIDGQLKGVPFPINPWGI